MPQALATLGIKFTDLALDLVELAEELQRLLADLAAMVGPQLMELRLAWARHPASVTPSSKQAL